MQGFTNVPCQRRKKKKHERVCLAHNIVNLRHHDCLCGRLPEISVLSQSNPVRVSSRQRQLLDINNCRWPKGGMERSCLLTTLDYNAGGPDLMVERFFSSIDERTTNSPGTTGNKATANIIIFSSYFPIFMNTCCFL